MVNGLVHFILFYFIFFLTENKVENFIYVSSIEQNNK